MKRLISLLLFAATVVYAGCNTKTATAPSTVGAEDSTVADASTSQNADDPAQYDFHRNIEFADVTKNMPEGSVDHIDFNMAAKPNVIVVVTVTAEPKAGLSFTTTFTGPNDLNVVKEWTPAEQSDETTHVGLFILPDAIDSGSTVVH